jgi:hypothetical protein
VYYLPWWGLLACLAASALAAYLVLGRTQAGDSPWALFPLTVALAPVVLLGAMIVAITLSTLLSAFLLLEDRSGHRDPSELSAPTERTGSEATPKATGAATTLEHPVPTTSASSTASPSASASASPPASASASSPSASAGVRTPPR